MIIFFFFYGIAEIANAIFVYGTKREWFNLVITSFWGITFILVALSVTFELCGILAPMSFWKNAAYLLYGLSWLPMMFTPCAIKLLKRNNMTLLARKITFLIIGLSEWLFILIQVKFY